MGLCVMASFLLMMTMFPFALVALEWCKIQGRCCCCCPARSSHNRSEALVVPAPPAEDSSQAAAAAEKKKQSVMSRFFGGVFARQLRAHRYVVLFVFAVPAISAVISIPFVAKVSSDKPA